MAQAVVVGAANMDIGALSGAALRPRDSNPGVVRAMPGGVGRNIAHNLCLLGVDTALITALGEDAFAAALRRNAAQIGLSLRHSVTVSGSRTSTYVYVAGPDGDMVAAVNDMDIYEHLTPQALAPKLPILNSARVVVLDANLPPRTLRWIGEHCTAPLLADPVSAVKAERLRPLLPRLRAMKPNRLEAEVLSGVAIHCVEDAVRAGTVLLDQGVEQVYLSLSGEGLVALERHRAPLHVPCSDVQAVNTTGAGDAMVAALAASLLHGLELPQSAQYAMAAGALTSAARETICDQMSWAHLKEMIRK